MSDRSERIANNWKKFLDDVKKCDFADMSAKDLSKKIVERKYLQDKEDLICSLKNNKNK